MTKIRQNKQKHPLKKGLLILAILLAGLLTALPVHAQTVADAVQQVANSLGYMEYDYIPAESTDFNIPVYFCMGDYQNGQAGIYALGPLTAEDKEAVSTQLFDYSGSTGSATTPMKGGEVRRYVMENQVFMSVVLNDYMVVAQIYETGNSAEQDFPTATEYAQLMLDALEKNGQLGGKAPDLEAVITNTAPSSVTGEGVPGGQSAGNNGNTSQNGTYNGAGSYYPSDSPAAIGPVGNIPGPANNTESVVGVVVPGLLAVGLGALSGLAGSRVPPTGGATPPVRETGFKRSKFSEDETTDRETDVDETSASVDRELTRDENQFRPREQIFTDRSEDLTGYDPGDDMILEKFKDVLPEEETPTADTDGMVVDTSEIIPDETILSDDFGGVPPETDILAEDGSRVSVNATETDEGPEILSDDYEDFYPEEDTILTDSDQVVVDESAFETGKKTDPDHLEETEILNQTRVTEDGAVIDDNAVIDDENPVVSDAITSGDQETINKEGISDGINPEDQQKPGEEKPEAKPETKGSDAVKEETAAEAAAATVKQKGETSPESTDEKDFDKNGFDKDGYDQDGFDKNGYDKDGCDRFGYQRDGFNKNGYDRDGYDLQGFDYKGYNRDGFDPFGYNRQGYGKDGYHWSGYNADGYDRDGKYWSDLGYDPEHRNPFDGGPVSLDGRPVVDTKPTAPPLGQPYPKTAEQFGPKTWDTPATSAPETPTAPTRTAPTDTTPTGTTPTGTAPTDTTPDGATPDSTTPDSTTPTSTSPEGTTTPGAAPPPETPPSEQPPTSGPFAPDDPPKDTGIIGPEDPMNTLNQHPLDGESSAAGPTGQTPSSQPQAIPTDQDLKNSGIDGDQTDVPEVPSETPPVQTFPKDGETKTLVGQTDGRTYEIQYDGKTGQWINTESGNYFDPDKFGKWQDDLAVDKTIAADTMKKFATGQDADSQAINQHMADFTNLEQVQKTADKFDFGTPGGPGDVDKAIQDLKDEMLSGKDLDHDKLEKIKNVIESRIKGQSSQDSGQKWTETPWYEDANSALKANAESIRNIVTGEDEYGKTSYMGMAGRMVIGAATGGTSEYVMTVAEALNNVKKGIDAGKTGWDATTGAMTQVVTDEVLSFGFEKAGELGAGFVKNTFPKTTQTLGDLVDAAGSKIDDLNQKASKNLGHIADEGADKAVEKINQNMAKKASQTADEIVDDATKAAKKSADEIGDDAAKAAKKSADEIGDDAAKAAKKSADEIGDDATKAAKKSADEIGDDATKAAQKSADDLAEAKGLKPGDKPDKKAIDEATQKIKDQKDKISQKTDEMIDDYRNKSKPDADTIERDEMFKEGRKAGQQKVDDLKTAQDQYKANPDSAEAKKAYEDAMTNVQQDKHAMHAMNDLEGPDAKEIREAFNTKMSHKADVADLNAKERIAKEYGIPEDQVKTVGATNTMDTSGKADPTGFAKKPEGAITDGTKTGKYSEDTLSPEVKCGDKTSYDIDKTYRVQVGESVDPITKKVTPIYKDIPAADTKRIFGEEYYKQFHDGKLPTKIENGIEVVDSKKVGQFADEMDVAAVDHRSAEGYGASDADMKEMLKKDGTVKKLGDIEAGTKTMEYKANEWENRAEKLREDAKTATGAKKAELLAKAEGLSEESMRQTTKQFNNQICEQVKAINLAKGQDVVKIPDKLFTAINVMEKVGKPNGGLSVVEAEAILKGMGLTPKQVSEQMSSVMESMQKFNQ